MRYVHLLVVGVRPVIWEVVGKVESCFLADYVWIDPSSNTSVRKP